jgi:hypothetical protein
MEAAKSRSPIAAEFGEQERPDSAIRPIYIRLPKPGNQCRWTGLSRSALADLCVPGKANGFRPPVKSIAPKKRKDAKRAVRLIVFESLMSYLRQFEEAA